MSDRKLATIRRIDEVNPIEGADAIEVVTVGGWKVVVKKDEFKVGDFAVYLEVDSWCPHALAPFLSRGNEPREFEGIKGERLRTIRLRGQNSQGLLLPMSILSNYGEYWRGFVHNHWERDGIRVIHEEGSDCTELLGILKYEKPLPAQLAGVAKGNFPGFIRKTDQERIQNLTKDLSVWSQNLELFEVSEKLDGSSMTVFFNSALDEQDRYGVCSRNLQLKYSEGNSFWEQAIRYDIETKLRSAGLNIAIQGELVGEGIQGNKYKLTSRDFFVFDVFDISTGSYYSSAQRLDLCAHLGLKEVPILAVISLANYNVDSILSLAEAKSELNNKTEREGLVFKSIANPDVSFKAISNAFLIKNGDD